MLYFLPICFFERTTLYAHMLTQFITKETSMKNFTWDHFSVFSLYCVYTTSV